jgi:hypothetical protein
MLAPPMVATAGHDDNYNANNFHLICMFIEAKSLPSENFFEFGEDKLLQYQGCKQFREPITLI